MAITPKYFSRASLPSGTGQAMAPISLAETGAAQMGQMVTQAANQIQAAGERIQSRADIIQSSRIYNEYYSELSKEYNRWRTEEDLATDEGASKFSQFIANKKTEILGKFSGSQDAYAKLDVRLNEEAARFGATALEAIREVQNAERDQAWGGEISRVSESLLRGEIGIPEALKRIDTVGEDFSNSYGNIELVNQVEAAQNQVITQYADLLLAGGQMAELKQLIDQEEEVFKTVPPNTMSTIMRNIAIYDREQTARAIERDNARQTRIDALLVNGKTLQTLTAEERFYVETGTWRPTPKSDLTEDQRNLLFLSSLPEGSPERNAFAQMIGVKESLGSNQLAALAARDAQLARAGVPPTDSQRSENLEALMAADPLYLDKLDAEVNVPTRLIALRSANDAASTMQQNIETALLYATGLYVDGMNPQQRAKAVEEAFKLARKGKEAFFVGGVPGVVTAFVSGSSAAANFEAALKPIQSAQVLSGMDAARESSGNGSTGFGAMDRGERELLQSVDGSLDPFAVEQTMQTLIRIHSKLAEMKTRNIDRFNQQHSVINVQYEPKSNPLVTAPGAGQVDVRQGADNVPIIRLGGLPAAQTSATQPAQSQDMPQGQQAPPLPVTVNERGETVLLAPGTEMPQGTQPLVDEAGNPLLGQTAPKAPTAGEAPIVLEDGKPVFRGMK